MKRKAHGTMAAAGLLLAASAQGATSATVNSLHNLYSSAPSGGLPYPMQGIIDDAPEGLSGPARRAVLISASARAR